MTLPPDDERTVLASNRGVPGPGGETLHNALPAGTRLGEFEITGLLGEGGFGIVYLAYDSSLERHVALKEYMPSAFASRNALSEVRIKSERHLDTFQAGLRSFVNEARMLAQFDHPSLIKVYRFWEANGTAYMIMPYYQGITLKQALRERTDPVDEVWLKSLLAPLLDTLALIHSQHCFHRDIAPDNIMMIDEGQPVLLDFGAARRAISGMDQAFTVILKQGYAPIEQYAETPGMNQGPWTDLFALASVIHLAIDGKPPPPAVGRAMSDSYIPLAQRYAGSYSARFLSAIDQALSVRPENRPQSAAAMRVLLDLGHAGAALHLPPSSPVGPLLPAATAATATTAATTAAATAAPSAAPVPADAGKARIIGGAVVAALLATAGVGYAMYDKPAAPGPAPGAAVVAKPVAPSASAVAPVARTSVTPVVAPVVASVVAPVVASVVAPVAASVVTPISTSVATPVAQRASATPFDPVAALSSVVAQASAERRVKVEAGKPRLRIDRDRMTFTVTSSHAGFIYVQMMGTVPQNPDNFIMLFPNALDQNNRIKAGETIQLPRKGGFLASGPAGKDSFVVIVSDVARDFSATKGIRGEVFLEFPPARSAQALLGYTETTPLFAGVPVCPESGSCSTLYGASMFEVEEFVK